MPIDKVRPLKLEDPSTGGTETNLYPTEMDPTEDYCSVKGVVFEDEDDQTIEIDGSGNMTFEDPVTGSKTLAELAEGEGGGGSQRLGWTIEPTGNGEINWLGWARETDSGESLTSASPVTASVAGFHSHFTLNVADAVGAPFTIRITGRSVNESTGVETPGDTEDFNITANGYYQSAKSWIDAPEFSIIESSKSCTIDISRVSYWDRGNSNFTLTGCRMEFTPDVTTWHITVKVYKVNDNGSLTIVDDTTLANTDTVPRAENGEPGKYKRGDYDTAINGANKEGFIVLVDTSGIQTFYLEIKYE